MSGSQRGLNVGKDDMAPVSKHRENVGKRIPVQTYTWKIINSDSLYSNEKN